MINQWKSGAIAVVLLWSILAAAQASRPEDAIAFEQQGRLQEAAEVWRAVVAHNPNDAWALASLGVVLSKEQKYPEAATAYRKALTLNPRLPGLQLNLGLAEFKQGHFQSAIPPLSKALAADPGSSQARILLGMSYGAKRFDEAIKYLEPAAKADPANTELHQDLAQSCMRTKNYSCALEEFRKILEQDPNSAAAHILTGEALDGLQKTNEAIAEFEAAANIAPRQPELHFGLGYLYWKSHQYDDAKHAFEAELSIDPGNAQALAYEAVTERGFR